MNGLLQRELVVVGGKGGVGKTTIAAAMGLSLARTGVATAMVEMTGSGSLAGLFGEDGPCYGGVEVEPGLHAFSISAEQAVEEYLVRQLRFRLLYDLVFGNRFIAPFMNAVMGLSDLISLGKVMDLGWEEDGSGTPRFGWRIIDAPATGHGLTMLRSPRAMMDVARGGPLYHNAKLVDDLLSDASRSALVLVTLPEELPVNETLEMAEAVVDGGWIHLAAVVINGVPLEPLTPVQEQAYRAFLDDRSSRLGGQAGRALREVERMLARRRRVEAQIARLRDALDVPLVEVPLLPASVVGPGALGEIADHLEVLM